MPENDKTPATTKHCHVVAMPYPGRGHINPMLNLCKLILSKSNDDFLFTFVVTEEWLGLLSSDPKPPANIRFASLPQVIPSEASRADDMAGFIEAVLAKLKNPFERLIDGLEPPPTAIVYDTWLSTWMVDVANRRNIAVASLFPMSASVFTVFYHFDLLLQHAHFPLNVSEKGDEIVDYIPGLPTTTIKDLTTIFEGHGKKMILQLLDTFSILKNATCLLFTSIYEFEEQVIDSIKENLPIPAYHIGPMIPYFESSDKPQSSNENYLQWLDSQPNGSVLYISQGSFLSISTAQMDEIIAGIKESGVRFLWVTRGDTSRFKDGVSEMGCFVSWCDQLRVLCHPSVGGFWTHCGWNSTSESIYAGVPMLTCPIFWDQMPNSKLIVNDLKIGWRVIDNGCKKEKFVTREEIAKLVRNFMDFESDVRKEMVERAKGLKDIFRRAIADGGSAASDIDAFIKYIS